MYRLTMDWKFIMRKLCRCIALINALVFFTYTSIVFAEPKAKIDNLTIPNSTLSAEIDGVLDDEIWQEAIIIELDLVNSPWNNLPSPIKTTAKVVENGEFLYVSFIAHDPNPDEIKGFLDDRDTRWSDDLVGIKLDTQNNRRLNYEFIVNPLGVQHDGIFNEMTGEGNDLWDGIWQSFGKITDQGFQVEMAIPYRILNFEENNDIKTWAFELFRIYPRDIRLRISHVAIDRDNACWLCQYPEMSGFEKATIGNNLQITPAIVANSNQTKDIYTPQSTWEKDNEIEAGIDLRWGINPNNSLNLTLNPDFSTVEADAGQLSINKTFSLFYNEKRAFFLDNADYFSSNYNLVYTRNIGNPDYGAKLTGQEGNHSYGFFTANDTKTTFIDPGNIGSSLISFEEKSLSTAFKYRYDVDDDFSVGVISTLRNSDSYHNYVYGIDSKYRFDDSNSILVQALGSDSQFKDTQAVTDAYLSPIKLSDNAYKIDLIHQSEYWSINAGQQYIGQEFRADLGYMPKADYVQSDVHIERIFYGDNDSLWPQTNLIGEWEIQHNTKGELITKSLSAGISVEGPYISSSSLFITDADRVGLRYDPLSEDITDNTSRFNEQQVSLYTQLQPLRNIFLALELTVGDKIDYLNDRLGETNEIYTNITWHVSKHFTADVYHTYSQLTAENPNTQSNEEVYTANLTNIKLTHQFNVNSYLKLTLTYSDIKQNIDNNPFTEAIAKDKYLTSQLIYAYKLNPQTVFFLGYSDQNIEDDTLKKLEKTERTFFTKISYAWMQ